MSTTAPLSVIVPACNEGRDIERVLGALTADPHATDLLDILVVCNGCTDDTAARAAAHTPPVRVLEEAVASKPLAIAAGMGAARCEWVAIVDADVEISGADLRRVLEEMSAAGALAGGPARRFDFEGSHWVVRSYYTLWQSLANVRSGLFGRGVVVLSPSARERVGNFVGMLSDDLVISDSFTPADRHVSRDAVVHIRAPRTVEALVRRRTRVVSGVAQVRRTGQVRRESRTSMADLVRSCTGSPRLLIHLPAFLGITWAARRASAKATLAGRETEWLRDDSSRG